MALVGALEAVDRRIDALACDASRHLGVEYKNTGLDARGYLSGGATGEAGDLWFEVDHPYRADPPPWEVTARIVVFCERRSCTHDLYRFRTTADNAQAVITALEQAVDALRGHVLTESADRVRYSKHAELPPD